MVLGIVTSDGSNMPAHYFKANVKANTYVYYNVLRYHVVPWLKSTFPRDKYVFTKTAPRHIFLDEEHAAFWPTNFWPSSSHDVSLLEFAVWCFLEGKTNKTYHLNGNPLKVVITEEWNNLSWVLIKVSCASFRPPIEAIIQNEGGHIQ
uniref:Uncharacterized protein n=1 Tax=Lepeophtheirus salmonis TaxID=72036 RepID=A0A0K2VCU6_LEPSM